MKHPVFKANLIYKNHDNIHQIKKKTQENGIFCLEKAAIEKTEKDIIDKLSRKITSQNVDIPIPTRIIKENSDTFADADVQIKYLFQFRSSHQRCSIIKAVLKNFAIITGKHLCWSFFLIKLLAFRPATLLKKRLQHRCFPVDIVKFLRTAFSLEHLRWLLLKS